MPTFQGFSAAKVRLTPVPAPFFSELLPEIDHLGELKITLYVFWRLDQMEGDFRVLKESDFRADALLMRGLAANAREAEARLAEALERAVIRGTLLKATLEGEAPETLYFLNSPKGRAALEAVQRGKWRPSDDLQTPLELNLDRPNIFRLYEQNIGPLTPILADMLREAEKIYPQEWIEDAVRLAVENNKRSWRYVDAILRRWQEQGRDEKQTRTVNRRDTEKDRRRSYADWETPD